MKHQTYVIQHCQTGQFWSTKDSEFGDKPTRFTRRERECLVLPVGGYWLPVQPQIQEVAA